MHSHTISKNINKVKILHLKFKFNKINFMVGAKLTNIAFHQLNFTAVVKYSIFSYNQVLVGL